MTVVEILRAARALIVDPERHSRERYCVKHEDGRRSYCTLGALMAVENDARPFTAWRISDSPDLARAATALAGAMGRRDWGLLPVYNDALPHADVLAMFDRAILNEEAREQEFTVEPTRELVPA